MSNTYDLIKPARLTKGQMRDLGIKRPSGMPAGHYTSTINNLLRLRDLGKIFQYENNRGLKINTKTGMLNLNKANIDTVKREFDPFALGIFGFAILEDGALMQASAHHRLEVCAQKKAEGFDFSGETVIITIVEEESQILFYTREGEQWSQTMGQRVTNPDLLYGYYYNHVIEQAAASGVKISATNLPKAQVSQVVEAILTGNKDILKVGNFGKVWNGRHDIKKKANTPFETAKRDGELLSKDEEFQLVEAAIYLDNVLNAVKHLPVTGDAVKELLNLPMFKGLIFCCRAGLTHQERTRRATSKRWVTILPERLAVRLATNASELRKKAQMISSGTLDEQKEALHILDRILSKTSKGEIAVAEQVAKSLAAKKNKNK